MSSSQLNLTAIIAYLLAGGRLVFARHGNTAKAQDDAARELTPLGTEQAAATREFLHANYMVFLVLSSIARRAVNTVSDMRWSTPIGLPELYLSPRKTEADREEYDAIDEAFNRLKYIALEHYLQEERAAKAMKRWAERAALALDGAFAKYQPGNGTVVVGGHAIMTNSMVIEIATAFDPDADISVALKTAMGEATCIELQVVDGVLRMKYLDATHLGHPVAA